MEKHNYLRYTLCKGVFSYGDEIFENHAHFLLEHIFVEYMADYLSSCLDNVRIQYEKNISPFQVI